MGIGRKRGLVALKASDSKKQGKVNLSAGNRMEDQISDWLEKSGELGQYVACGSKTLFQSATLPCGKTVEEWYNSLFEGKDIPYFSKSGDNTREGCRPATPHTRLIDGVLIQGNEYILVNLKYTDISGQQKKDVSLVSRPGKKMSSHKFQITTEGGVTDYLWLRKNTTLKYLMIEVVDVASVSEDGSRKICPNQYLIAGRDMFEYGRKATAKGRMNMGQAGKTPAWFRVLNENFGCSVDTTNFHQPCWSESIRQESKGSVEITVKPYGRTFLKTMPMQEWWMTPRLIHRKGEGFELGMSLTHLFE